MARGPMQLHRLKAGPAACNSCCLVNQRRKCWRLAGSCYSEISQKFLGSPLQPFIRSMGRMSSGVRSEQTTLVTGLLWTLSVMNVVCREQVYFEKEPYGEFPPVVSTCSHTIAPFNYKLEQMLQVIVFCFFSTKSHFVCCVGKDNRQDRWTIFSFQL